MYTLKNFMSLPQLENALVLTEPSDFSHLEINYISVAEPPVEAFVREKELVLSTALGCTDDDDKFFEFVKEIYECHPTALMLCFKPEDKPVPERIISFANELNFPVIRIPWECHFSELIKLAFDGIKLAEDSCRIEYDNLQKKLLNSFLSEMPLETAAVTISETFNASVVIYDRYHKARALHMIDNRNNSTVYLSEIKVNGYLYGYIEISDLIDEKTDIQIDKSFLENYLSIPLSLWFNKEDVINLTSLRIKNDYIWKLAGSNEENIDKLIIDGQNLDFNLDISYIGVTFRIFPDGSAPTDDLSIPSYTTALPIIENLILAEGKLENVNLMITFNDGIFLMYIGLKDTLSVNKFLDRLEALLLNEYPEYRFFWGIGEVPPKERGFSQQYKKALFALEQCIDSNLPERRLTYKDSRITGLIYHASGNEQLKDQAQQTLGKIFENDKNNTLGMNLMQTLTTFLKCNYNASLTARELHLHRQSLLYRLEKIEQLTECSLSNHDDLFLLEFYSRLLLKF